MECMLSSAKKVSKKKFGYQRSPKLTKAGTELHFLKAVVSSKAKKRKLGSKQLHQAELCSIDLEMVANLSARDARKQVRTARQKLWDVQKDATRARIEWLETNAQNISKAAGEIDWEGKMKTMAKRWQRPEEAGVLHSL